MNAGSMRKDYRPSQKKSKLNALDSLRKHAKNWHLKLSPSIVKNPNLSKLTKHSCWNYSNKVKISSNST